jgi:hypothetical protein
LASRKDVEEVPDLKDLIHLRAGLFSAPSCFGLSGLPNFVSFGADLAPQFYLADLVDGVHSFRFDSIN